ncbi:DUF1707 SHOCT-like domain-containing protein [Streptosporangium lutulentum]|uniref:Membrane protein n=1 Tax=Streptosporangium lutulentum TaxID=1461250 RepID=A0ABT9Q445_9ACTN|nr:DUF1707 domain-containing protein [Streptosporangium lutulentum]MDP9841508.1 putative membrane protein [Streptosporangium lutulentum]
MIEIVIVSGLLAVVAITAIMLILRRLNATSRRRSPAMADREQVAFERWLGLQPTDAERQLALGHLDEIFTSGRIDQEEHTKRIAMIMEARTNRETEDVLSELRPADEA